MQNQKLLEPNSRIKASDPTLLHHDLGDVWYCRKDLRCGARDAGEVLQHKRFPLGSIFLRH
jgi:hypothetical protein